MAGRIIYLEVDDEITSAAARIRDAEADRLALVLPYGSRVATSRINFRLLSRDAMTHDKRLSIVAYLLNVWFIQITNCLFVYNFFHSIYE